MGFSRQEYWSRLPSPSPGDLPDPGIEPWSPTFQADTLTSEPPGKPWWKVKEESEKVGLKLNIQKTKIMASSTITSWQIDGETMETVRDCVFVLWNHCRLWLQPWNKRCLFLGRKAMANLDITLKSRDIPLPTKVCLVNVMVFPVVTYGCESWTIKKLRTKELMFLNCGVGEDSWESLGLQGDQMSLSYRKSVLNIQWKDWCWSCNSNNLATWCKELTPWKRPWCGRDWRPEEKGMTEDKMVGWHHRLNGHEFE